MMSGRPTTHTNNSVLLLPICSHSEDSWILHGGKLCREGGLVCVAVRCARWGKYMFSSLHRRVFFFVSSPEPPFLGVRLATSHSIYMAVGLELRKLPTRGTCLPFCIFDDAAPAPYLLNPYQSLHATGQVKGVSSASTRRHWIPPMTTRIERIIQM
jgi:hypothetical protein